jgi:hypothetical protein
VRERIARTELGARCKKEEQGAGAVRNLHLAQRLHDRPSPAIVGRDGEHAKCVPSELPFVLFGGVSGEVRPPFTEGLSVCLVNAARLIWRVPDHPHRVNFMATKRQQNRPSKA